jgi:hypothetical protein
MGAGDDDDAVATAEDVATEVAVVELTFTPPTDCTTLLPDSAVSSLAAEGIELVKGPGSPST